MHLNIHLQTVSKDKSTSLELYEICPIDSTIISLTSKLLWALGYHQVKRLSVFNNSNQTGEYPLIHFGQDHDYKFATKMTENLTEKQVGVMDRRFAALEYLKQLLNTMAIISFYLIIKPRTFCASRLFFNFSF